MLDANYFGEAPKNALSSTDWVVVVEPTQEERELLQCMGIDPTTVYVGSCGKQHWLVSREKSDAVVEFLTHFCSL